MKFFLLQASVIFAHNTNIGADMDSEPMTLTNPACVITEVNGNFDDLPVLEPDSIPNPSDYFELIVETQKGFYPYLARSSGISVQGIDIADYEENEIMLKELTPSGQESSVDTNSKVLESTMCLKPILQQNCFFSQGKQKTNIHLSL